MRTLWIACAVLSLFAFSTARTQNTAKTVRIGVYDNRAIAVAWTPSKYNPVQEWTRQHESAQAAGDTKRAAQLEEQGQSLQRRLHRQAFGRAPVDDLLAYVEDRLADVAGQTGVDAIASHCNFTTEHVEVVDITDELVQLFDPSERTLKIVADLKSQDPIDLDEIEKSHDH